MLGIIGNVIGGVLGIGKSYMSRKKEESEAKHALRLAELNNKCKLMQSSQEYNQTWEMNALKETGKFLKIFCFMMFSIPIVMNMFFPYFGLDSTLMWVGLKQCPDWWVKIFTSACGAIWGCMELRNMGGIRGIIGKSAKLGSDTKQVGANGSSQQLMEWFNEIDKVTKEKS